MGFLVTVVKMPMSIVIAVWEGWSAVGASRYFSLGVVAERDGYAACVHAGGPLSIQKHTQVS